MASKHRQEFDPNSPEYRDLASKKTLQARMMPGRLVILVGIEQGLWHLSISHKNRYPTMDEIRDARYRFLPDNIVMAMLYPPKSQYINIHANCFHLWQIGEQNENPSPSQS